MTDIVSRLRVAALTSEDAALLTEAADLVRLQGDAIKSLSEALAGQASGDIIRARAFQERVRAKWQDISSPKTS